MVLRGDRKRFPRHLGAYFGVVALTCGILFAAPAQNGQLVRFFPIEKNPGSGKLIYTLNKKSTTLQLGAEHYGIAFLIKTSDLPREVAKELGTQSVLQIALGNLGTSKSVFPQFCALSLLVKNFPERKANYPVELPIDNKKFTNLAILHFAPPTLSPTASDEDKLKSTFFGDKGLMTLVPLTSTSLIHFNHEERKLIFQTRRLSVTIDTTLVTPFNPVPGHLKGTVEIPLYWPFGREAENFTRQAFQTGLEPPHVQPVPEGVSHHKEEVAGSTRDDLPTPTKK